MIFAGSKVRRLEDSLRTLAGQVSELERLRKQDLIDMDDMYEKVRRVLGRISKREQRVSQGEGEPEPVGAPCDDPITARVMGFRNERYNVLGKSKG